VRTIPDRRDNEINPMKTKTILLLFTITMTS
jgi:hypothetical protein